MTRPVAAAFCTRFQKKCGIERVADEITDSTINNGKLKGPVDDCDVSESVTREYP